MTTTSTIQGDQSSATGSTRYDPTHISLGRKVLTRTPGLAIPAAIYYRSKDQATPGLNAEQRADLSRERFQSAAISFAILTVVAVMTAIAFDRFGGDSLKEMSPWLFATAGGSFPAIAASFGLGGMMDDSILAAEHQPNNGSAVA